MTSIAIFHYLEDNRIDSAREVAEALADDVRRHFEQSYMPSMLRLCSYDTVCHEHLEYYSLGVVRGILDRVDLRVVDVQMNSVNGGSFAITATKRQNKMRRNDAVIDWLLEQEDRMGHHHAASLSRLRGEGLPPPRRPGAAGGRARGRR